MPGQRLICNLTQAQQREDDSQRSQQIQSGTTDHPRQHAESSKEAASRQADKQADLTVNLLLEQLPGRIQIDLISSLKPGAARGNFSK